MDFGKLPLVIVTKLLARGARPDRAPAPFELVGDERRRG
jgi:hypothetical protein